MAVSVATVVGFLKAAAGVIGGLYKITTEVGKSRKEKRDILQIQQRISDATRAMLTNKVDVIETRSAISQARKLIGDTPQGFVARRFPD